MIKDTLHKVLDCFDAGRKVSLNITVGGLDKKARVHVVSVLKSAIGWHVDTENTPFPGGYIYPKDPTYEHVDITLYKPDEKRKEEKV